MTIQEARRAGAQAFRDGRQNAPALNNAFIVAACRSDVRTADLLAAYSEGWHVANLAHNAPLLTMPSVGRLAEILSK